jgi:hypothetical protein
MRDRRDHAGSGNSKGKSGKGVFHRSTSLRPDMPGLKFRVPAEHTGNRAGRQRPTAAQVVPYAYIPRPSGPIPDIYFSLIRAEAGAQKAKQNKPLGSPKR